MRHGAVADGPDKHERRRPHGPAEGPAQEVERGIFQPVQAVAQGATRVIYVGQPGGGDGGRVDVGGRVGPCDERGAGQSRDPEDGVGGRVQSGCSLTSVVGKANPSPQRGYRCRVSGIMLWLGKELYQRRCVPPLWSDRSVEAARARPGWWFSSFAGRLARDWWP